MKTLYRYVLRELLSPTLLGFGLFTFALLMNALLQFASMIIEQGVGAGDVGRLFLYSVPHTIVLTVPMAVLLGGLITFGRMSSDSEVVAMRSGGISLYHLAVPILVLAAVAWLFNSYLTVVVLPYGNNQLRQLQWQLVTRRAISSQIKPRVIHDDFPNFILYIEDVTETGDVWNNVFLAKTDETPPMIVLAKRGIPAVDEESRVFWLRLEEGVQYAGGQTAQEVSVTTFERLDQVLKDLSNLGDVGPIHKDDRSMTLPELRAEIARREAVDEPTAGLRVEVHKRFAFPVACLVLGMIALPLGVSTQRHTKATGFVLAIAVIAVYYQFIENGEKFAEEGALPAWIGVWSANLVLAAAAAFLLWAKTREVNWHIADTLGRVTDRLVGLAKSRLRGLHQSLASLERRRRAAVAVNGFPRIIDRYVLAHFGRIFALAITFLVVLWVLSEYSELADDLFAADKGFREALEYFKFQLPFIVSMSLPIATLVAVLTALSLMSKSSEVVAAMSGGISLYRLAAPLLLPALLLTGVEFALQDYILPSTNLRATEIRDSWRPGNPAQTYRPAGGTWLFGQEARVFNYADYDQEHRVFQGLHVFYLAEEGARLTRVEYGERVEWQDGQWLAHRGWRRYYTAGSVDQLPAQSLQEFVLLPLPFPEPPSYFESERRQADQMPAMALRSHIQEMEQRGYDAHRLRVDFHQKLAFPAVIFVLALVGIPFGFRMGRQGTLSGVGIALGLAMVFWTLFVAFRAIGYAEILPPLLAAWTPHILFLALAGYLTLGLRS